jgi:hypothetical protein
MTDTTIYIIAAVLVLIALIAIVFLLSEQRLGKQLTPLASIALVLVISGIVFGDNRAVGYGLMGAGILVAVADIVIKRGTRGA